MNNKVASLAVLALLGCNFEQVGALRVENGKLHDAENDFEQGLVSSSYA